MALETVTHISDLNASNPAAGDNVSEGDDHIRNIKTALTTDFAGISGAVTATHTELNRCDITTLGTIAAGKVVTCAASGNIFCNSSGFFDVALQTGTIAGAVTGTTQDANDASTKLATTAYVDTQVGTLALQTVRKPDTEIVNGSDTLQDDDDLVFTNLATGAYTLEALIIVTSNSTADFKFDFDTTGISGSYAYTWNTGSTLTGGTSPTDLGDDISVGSADTTRHYLTITGEILVSLATNELQYRWAQSTADASNTSARGQSWMKISALA